MKVYWLEQAVADVPAEDGWLSATEVTRLNTMRFAKRRADWRLGRWTAKRALAAHLKLAAGLQPLAAIEIRPASTGAPEAFLQGNPAAVAISLSHRAGRAICAIAQSGVALGCDLEMIEERSYAFVADYFTAQEQDLIGQVSAGDHYRLVALLGSGKESALKALGEGLRLDTRSVAITPISGLRPPERPDGWRPLEARCGEGQVLHGWWQQEGSLLRTVIATPPPEAPILCDLHHDPHARDAGSCAISRIARNYIRIQYSLIDSALMVTL